MTHTNKFYTPADKARVLTDDLLAAHQEWKYFEKKGKVELAADAKSRYDDLLKQVQDFPQTLSNTP